MEYKYEGLSVDEIKEILLNNNFKILTKNILIKESKNYSINFLIDSNTINYTFENNGLNYLYSLNLNRLILNVLIYDENNTEIENYQYNVKKKKIIKCTSGSCNNYEEAMAILNKNVLNLLKK